jgi:hypothetical protein
MIIANETQQAVYYTISCGSLSDSGTIEVNGLATLDAYDNQTNVTVQIRPDDGGVFKIYLGATKSGEQMEVAFVAE